MKYLLLPALCLLLVGCRDADTVWSEAYSFTDGVWKGDNTAVFLPDSAALASAARPGEEDMKALLTLRYGAQASVSEFNVIMEIENPGGSIEDMYRRDTLRFSLLEPGLRTGTNGKMGIFEVTDTVTLASPALPGWRMALSLPAYTDEIEGLFSLTITLIK